MLLLDASVWIDLLRGRDNGPVRYVMERQPFEDLALTPMTYFEVLQGARSAAEMDRLGALLRGYLLAAPAGLQTYEAAAALYLKARRGGIAIRTAVDCLIAAVAVENGAVLVHNDRDLLQLQRVEARLHLMPSAVPA